MFNHDAGTMCSEAHSGKAHPSPSTLHSGARPEKQDRPQTEKQSLSSPAKDEGGRG